MAGARSTPGVVTGSVVRWTIITVTHNSARALREAWHGLGLPESVEWIVIDNASSDDSVQAAVELGASRVVPWQATAGSAVPTIWRWRRHGGLSSCSPILIWRSRWSIWWCWSGPSRAVAAWWHRN